MRRRFATLMFAPLLMLAGCGGSGAEGRDEPTDTGSADPIADVEVSGSFGKEPQVDIREPLKLDETRSHVLIDGEGEPVVEGEQALLHIHISNGTTGRKAISTHDQGQPLAVPVSEDQVWPGVLEALVGQPSGSRVVVAATPQDAFSKTGSQQLQIGPKDPVVFVVDVLAVAPEKVLDGPQGTEQEVPDDLPTVRTKDGNVTRLSFEGASEKPADELRVVTLIEGEGPPARAGSLVTFDYLGQIYGSPKVFDESYSREPVTFPLGVGGLIKGWDEGLPGVKRGSRVMVIAPPEYGYGQSGNPNAGIQPKDTLVFVVDILGVS